MSTSPSTTPLNYSVVSPKECLKEKFEWCHREPKFVINATTDTSEDYFRAIASLVQAEIHTIEFIRTTDEFGHEHNGTRGAFLLNEDGYCVVHIVNALIGYGGSGPYLSSRVLNILGFSDEAFEVVNNAARPTNQNYYLILKRM